jgi:peptide deformylase
MARMRSRLLKMAKLMYSCNGCGIAAPQVGISKRAMIIDCGTAEEGEELAQDPIFFINPVVKETWGEQVAGDEGCLSIPGISVPIKRFEGILVEALDLDGRPFEKRAEGFEARAMQHELDHLDGQTMFERLDPVSRIDAFREYEQALAAGARPGDTGGDCQPQPQPQPQPRPQPRSKP